ncbi:MAG: VanW family protein, partial [Oscillospiraceae bacterium]|nr:VanW family protein [Oscillospiraceae bacterium]
GNGYQEAPEIAYGEYVTGVGGGVCQVSTTLYQAILRSRLKVEKRECHAIPSNYAPMGQDATVSDNGADFIFRNDTSYPVYIRARITTGTDRSKTKRCEISIYGRSLPDGIRYTLESRQLQEIQPGPPKYVADKKHEYVYYTDEEVEYLKARTGYKVEVYLVEQKDGVEQDRRLITTDVYNPRATVIYRGTESRD